MDYTPLAKIYYLNEQQHEAEYEARFNAPFTKHFNISIKPMDATESFPMFLVYPESLVLLLNKIHIAMKKLEKMLKFIPEVATQQFTFSSCIEEIQASSEIEGIHSTRREIIDASTFQGNKRNIRFGSIVDKYKKILTLEEIPFSSVEDIRALYDEFILSEIDPANHPDGEIFRKEVVNVTTGTQKIIHQGVLPEEKIINHLQIALNILYDESIPSFVRYAVFHYLFAYIHPFYDGNGRMDRFITSYFLARDTHPLVALRLSILIKQQRTKYYRLFSATNARVNRGDVTPFVLDFLTFFLEAITNTSDILHQKMLHLQSVHEALKPQLKLPEKEYTIYFLLLQATLFSVEGISIKELAEAFDKTTVTAKRYLDKLPKEHLIVDTSHREYRYKLNLRTFNLQDLNEHSINNEAEQIESSEAD